MKPKRIVLQALILSILIVFTTAVSDSTLAIANQETEEHKFPQIKELRGYEWFTCKIVMVGPCLDKVYFKLTDQGGAFSNRWYFAKSDIKKEMLATGLTAMSNNIKVYVCLTSSASYSEILALYLRH